VRAVKTYHSDERFMLNRTDSWRLNFGLRRSGADARIEERQTYTMPESCSQNDRIARAELMSTAPTRFRSVAEKLVLCTGLKSSRLKRVG
jgi:hypothetical protein